MDKATPAALKEMFRVMKFLVQTKEMGLKIAPNFNSDTLHHWKMKIFTDSNWAANVYNRKSVSGFVIFLQDTPVMWKSQQQQSVALSSTEAEYYTTAEATKEIKFIVQVLESMHIKVQKPIIVHLNVGAIFVAKNASATKHTRHIDARYHFVREYIIDGYIKIMFVSTKDNRADMFTKNVTSEVYEEHVGDFIIHRKITSKELDETQYPDSGGVLESGTSAYGTTKSGTSSTVQTSTVNLYYWAR
jgi:hypothetical protein